MQRSLEKTAVNPKAAASPNKKNSSFDLHIFSSLSFPKIISICPSNSMMYESIKIRSLEKSEKSSQIEQ